MAENQQLERTLKKQTHDLEGRIKELNCLDAICSLALEEDHTFEDILQRAVDIIRSTLRFPEITCVRIIVEGRLFKTDNFEETPRRQACDIVAHRTRIGTLEVFHLKEKPGRDEAPFLEEEGRLITSVADRLGKISERKKIEEELRESERKYTTLVEGSLTGIYIEQDGKIAFANKRCAEIHGFSKDELMGIETWRLIHPDDRVQVCEIATKRLQGEAVPSEYEARGLNKEGETIWIKRTNTRIDFQGKPAILGNIVEITQLKLNEKKERIIETIFQKLGRREGIRLKDVFSLTIPELADVMKIQSCALFSISLDREHVTLEAGYPEKGSYHGVGKVFSLTDEPYFNAILHQDEILGEYEHEKIYPSYILINNPGNSRLLTEDLRRFTATNNIHSILYVPLKTGTMVNYFLAFDAMDRHTSFTKDQIELLVFLGKELMKGVRIEQLDDILHDFKNPAIAAAGFARRIKKSLEIGKFEDRKKKILRDLEVILRETSRMQEMAYSTFGTGREEEVDMTRELASRLEINREAIREQKRRNIDIIEDLDLPLKIKCYPLHIERVFDNLLSNATNAIPDDGGRLIVKTYAMDESAVAEITNTGVISQLRREEILSGETKGRGLHITNRLVRIMGGRIELEVGNSQTTLRVYVPRISS